AARRDVASHAQRKLEGIEARLTKQREYFETARGGVEAQVATREDLARESAEGQAEVERLRAAVADAQREKRGLEDRLALLEEWRRNLEGFGEGARALIQADGGDHPPILGVVAQLVGALAGVALGLEAALGPFLHAVVVPSAEDACRAAAWLRAGQAGRALFLWPDEPEPPTGHLELPDADGDELLGYARDAAICRDELRGLVVRRLGATYVVRDLAVAERHWGDG